MAFLIIDGERYALPPGDTTLGGQDDEVLRLSPLAALPAFAILHSGDDGTTVRALSPSIPVSVQGQTLGASALALRHGDVLSIGTLTIHVGDLDKAGRTDHVSGLTDADVVQRATLATTDPTAPTGGRLTALSDGRVYTIASSGLVIGRDPDCGVVLTSLKVSRRHARVTPGLLGYSLIDDSINGVVVNGARLDGTCLLSQGDVIGIGEEAFRFSADPATYEPDAAVFASPAVPLHVSPPVTPRSTSPATEAILKAERPIGPPTPAAVLLASLEVLSGSLPAGTMFRVERPVVQIGRSPQSDVFIADESISATHATLLQRRGAWQILDLGSRNGTYVEGRRITECLLQGVCEVRLGMMTLLFRPIRETAADNIGTLGLIGITDAQRRSSQA